MSFVPAKFTQDGRQFHRPLQRFDDLLELQIALRGRPVGFAFFQEIFGVNQPRIFFFVIAPFDLSAFSRGWVAGVTQVGGIALVTQKRISNLLAGAGELFVWAKKRKRMVNRHDRKIFPRHLCDQPTPEPCADDNGVGSDRAAAGVYRLDAAVSDLETGCLGVLKDLQFAACFCLIDQFAGNRLGPGNDQAGIRIPHGALNHVLFDKRHLLFGFLSADHFHVGAKGPP